MQITQLTISRNEVKIQLKKIGEMLNKMFFIN